MSVADNYMPIRQIGNGSTVDFSEDWPIITPDFLKVELHAVSDGAITPQTGSDYTLVYSSAGFTVTFNTAPTASYYVVIYRDVTINQQTPFRTSEGFQGDIIELSFDKLTVIAQDLQNDSSRSLKFPIGSGVSDITLPAPVANATLAFNGTADALIAGATLGEIADAAQNAQDAEDAKDDAEEALASFQSQYLGSYATDPTQTPSGAPLASGMLYWNTASNELLIHNGTSWQSLPLPADGSLTLAKLANLPARTFIGNPDGDAATPQAMSVSDYLATTEIIGLTVSNNTTTPNTLLDIAAGRCWSSDQTTNMVLASGLTKDLAASFAEGTGNGGFATGESLPTSGTIHVWLITKADGTADVFANNHTTSGKSPTLPAGFVTKRRIGSRITDTSGNILPATQWGDVVRLHAPVADSVATNPGTSARLLTLSLPIGLRVSPIANVLFLETNASSRYGLYSDPETPDVAPTGSAFNYATRAAGGSIEMLHVTPLVSVYTNTSGQIRFRINSSAAGVVERVTTFGWIDERSVS